METMYVSMGNCIFIDEVSSSDSLCGFHAYDTYASCTAFNWEETPSDDIDWFYSILTHENGCPDALRDLVEFANEMDKGITIRGTYYEWSELQDAYSRAIETNIKLHRTHYL